MEENRLKNKGIFDGYGAMALIGGLVGGSIIVAVFNFIAMYVFKVNFQYDDIYLIISQIATFGGAIFAFDYFVYRPNTGRKLNFNFSPTNLMTYFLIFPMMFGMMLIAEFVTMQIPTSGPVFGEMYRYFSKLMDQMSSDPATLILLAVILAPIFEEIVFRGIIMKGLINKGMKPKKAIIIAAVVFGLVHANPWQFVGAVLLGLVLGLVYYKTKSLLLPILLHAFNNLISALLIFNGNTESLAETFHISEWILLGVGVILFTSFYILFAKRYRVHYAEA
ncbi:CPBP family intramembrane metalloprotease [Chryseobacterium sp. SNU WT5]|uniref:CPBP family intramembrane glutamic endopeptidase n=1 Tax=Chryseobacterium sp. SNU WT5 TaxID=2594269 RepID=UPI00117C9761|nr:type II CAAX endopeptidase family protein [Chryseobacterium sp. SNU WT5]QDP86521.1 CPBP family intramembrane metalloprotease [Chryseobacterium sp. SNU WT5]